MELVINNKKENQSKGLVVLTIILSIICGLYIYSNNQTHSFRGTIQQNTMYNSVDTFTNK